jgi:hypothetical protein
VSNYAFIGYRHNHGDIFTNTRQRPFDYMEMAAQWNFWRQDQTGRPAHHRHPGDREDRRRRPTQAHGRAGAGLHLHQTTNAFEFGGQDLGAVLWSRWGSVGDFSLDSRLNIHGTILGAVNSDYSGLAEVANQERIREYDYGPGVGAGAGFVVDYHSVPMLKFAYGLEMVYVTNGSVYHKDGKIGLDARHWLNSTDIVFETPAYKRYGPRRRVGNLHAPEPLQGASSESRAQRDDHPAAHPDQSGAEGLPSLSPRSEILSGDTVHAGHGAGGPRRLTVRLRLIGALTRRRDDLGCAKAVNYLRSDRSACTVYVHAAVPGTRTAHTRRVACG